jgi:hypothetical protein
MDEPARTILQELLKDRRCVEMHDHAKHRAILRRNQRMLDALAMEGPDGKPVLSEHAISVAAGVSRPLLYKVKKGEV